MINFENIEELAVHMFDKLDGDLPSSVVVNKDLAVEIMKELLEYDDVILNTCNIDTFEYDREYLVSLYDEVDTKYWYVDIVQIYDYELEKYLATDGYILFEESVNSKCLTDMQNNPNVEITTDWFTIGEEDEEDNELTESTSTTSSESVNVSRDKDGKPNGFTKSWANTTADGITYYSSYSHYTSDVDCLRKIAEDFGVNL